MFVLPSSSVCQRGWRCSGQHEVCVFEPTKIVCRDEHPYLTLAQFWTHANADALGTTWVKIAEITSLDGVDHESRAALVSKLLFELRDESVASPLVRKPLDCALALVRHIDVQPNVTARSIGRVEFDLYVWPTGDALRWRLGIGWDSAVGGQVPGNRCGQHFEAFQELSLAMLGWGHEVIGGLRQFIAENLDFVAIATFRADYGHIDNPASVVSQSHITRLGVSDMYRIVTSATAQGSMAIDLAPLGIEPALLDVRVFDSAGKSASTQRRFRSTGDVFVEVLNVHPNSHYYVRVQNKVGNEQTGNYLLMMNVADTSAELERIQVAALDATQSDIFGILTTYKTQLYRFDLTMTPSASNSQAAVPTIEGSQVKASDSLFERGSLPTTQSSNIGSNFKDAGPLARKQINSRESDQAVQLTIYSDSGRVELVISVRFDRKTVVYAWLNAGEHYLRFTATARGGTAVEPSVVFLDGATVSDDEGPILIDPSGSPVSGPQNPGINPNPPPTWTFPVAYNWLYTLVIPPETPWF